MKTGQLFWGAFFLTLGSLFLLVKYDVIDINWYFTWDLWPALLILWGLAVILKDTIIKPIMGVLFGLFLAVFIYGIFFNIFDVFDYNDDNYHSYESKTFYEEYSDDLEYANLELSAGVGSFSIRDKTSKLVKGTARGNIGSYSLYANTSDNSAWLDIDFGKNSFTFFDAQIKNRLELSLNDNPIWDLDLNLGAAKADFDLSQFKVSRVSLETGATKTRIRIGDKLERVKADVKMGAASLEFLIPEEFECKLSGDMVLIAKDIPGFEKLDSGYYVTPGYDFAEKKIAINVNGGVSSLKIHRY